MSVIEKKIIPPNASAYASSRQRHRDRGKEVFELL